MPEIIKVIDTGTPIKVISNLIPGATGETGAAGPNAVTSATTTNFTNGQILFANSGFVGSISRNGIDTRTSFPNATVTAATNSATPSTLVLRDANGLIGNEILQVYGTEANQVFLTYDGDTFALPFVEMQELRPKYQLVVGSITYTIESNDSGGVWVVSILEAPFTYIYRAEISNSSLLPWEIVGTWTVSAGAGQPTFTVSPEQTSKRLIFEISSNKYYIYDGQFREVIIATSAGSIAPTSITVSNLTVTNSATFTAASFTLDSTSATSLRNALAGTTGRLLMAANTTAEASSALGTISRLQVTDSATRNTTTYADSAQITAITLLAGITYDIHFFATFACTNTAGIKIRLLCPAFPPVVRMCVFTNATPTTVSSSGTTLEIVAISSSFSAGTGIREARGSFRPTANTTIVMQWATQNTPSGGDTAQILTGSFLRATPIV